MRCVAEILERATARNCAGDEVLLLKESDFLEDVCLGISYEWGTDSNAMIGDL